MKKKIIILSILGILLIALGISGYNLWDNYISPVITATKLTEKELEEATDDKKLIEDITGLKLRDMTEEEKTAIESGEKQESEVMEEILKEAMDEKIKETSETTISVDGNEEKKKDSKTTSDKMKSEGSGDKASDSPGKSEAPPSPASKPSYKSPSTPVDSSIITAKYLGELYSLQSTYSGIVAGMIPQIKSYYYNLRKVQKYDRESAIAATSKAYLGKVNAAEAECDSKVNGVISRMEKELKANGHSTEIISMVKSRYAAEKKSKRAYYVKLLMGN